MRNEPGRPNAVAILAAGLLLLGLIVHASGPGSAQRPSDAGTSPVIRAPTANPPSVPVDADSSDASIPLQSPRLRVEFLGNSTPQRTVVWMRDGRGVAPARPFLLSPPAYAVMLPDSISAPEIERLEFDGWASDQYSLRLHHESTNSFVLRARLPIATVLEATDPESGARLPIAGAIRAADYDEGLLEFPSAESLESGERIAGDPTQVVLPKSCQETGWWVRVDGFAWAWVFGGWGHRETRPDLIRASTLDVQVGGSTPLDRIQLYAARPHLDYVPTVIPSSAVPFPAFEAGTRKTTLTPLRPGPWRIIVVGTLASGTRSRIGFSDVTLEPGKTARRKIDVVIPIEKPPLLFRVSTDTTGDDAITPEYIGIESAWPHDLEISTGSELTSVPHHQHYAASVPALPAGTYRLTINPFEYSTFVEIEEGTTLVKVKVPRSRKVVVRVVSKKTKLPLDEAEVTAWIVVGGRAHPDVERLIGLGHDLAGTGKPGEYVATLPAGHYELAIDARGYSPELYSLHLPNAGLGQKLIVVELDNPTSCVVQITGDEEQIRRLRGHVEIYPDGPDGEFAYGSFQEALKDGSATFGDMTPGSYSVVIQLEGRNKRVGRSVTLPKGHAIVVKFKLEELQ